MGPVAAEGTAETPDETASFDAVRLAGRRLFFDALSARQGTKALVWDADLMKPFGLLAQYTELRQNCGVTSMFPLTRGALPAAAVDHVVIVSRATYARADCIASALRASAADERQLHVLFVPQMGVLREHQLREQRARLASLGDLPVHLFACDSDVVSMEAAATLRRCLVDDDWAALHDVALAVGALERALGRPSRVFFKGDWAQRVDELVRKQRRQDAMTAGSKASADGAAPLVDTFLLLDRWTDPITPLVTQLTYEGLIDESYGIRCGSVKMPRERFSEQSDDSAAAAATDAKADGEMKQVNLDANDELFAELRDLNFNAVGPTLSKRIKALSERMEVGAVRSLRDGERAAQERHSASTVREYKEFVRRLPQLQAARQAAALHTTIAELIKEKTTSEQFLETVQCEQEILSGAEADKTISYIEDAMYRNVPILVVLRLLCLHSLTCDGLRPRILEQYRRDLLQNYGYEHVALLVCLQKSGLLREKGASRLSKAPSYASEAAPFKSVRESFRLLVDDVNEQTPTDTAYVYSGLAPLSSRLAQYVVRPGWAAVADAVRRLPGATSADDSAPQSDSSRVVLVFFVGGVTRAEIAALRFLSKTEGVKFLVATTSILTGTSLLNVLGD